MNEIFPEDEAALQALIAAFEEGSFPIAGWRHAHHLVVAACYVLDGPDALDRLRTNIPRYNVSQGGQNTPDSGYHETLTVFWFEVVQRFIAGLPLGLSRLEITQRVVSEFAPRRDLFRDYYGFDVVKSREARATWIPPSRPLDIVAG